MLEFIQTNYEDVLVVVTSIVTIASVIARFTPTQVDNKIVDKLVGFVNKLALNKPRK